MSLKKLIESLKENEQRQIEIIWQQVQAEAESIQRETADIISGLRKKHDRELEASRQQCMRVIITEADNSARDRELHINDRLARELYDTALKKLPILRTDEYKNTFLQLAGELPFCDWQSITVNPQDETIAAQLFPNAAIMIDSSICGGLLAVTDDDRITVDNTLNKRLERHWEFLLPSLLQSIEAFCIRNDSADQSA